MPSRKPRKSIDRMPGRMIARESRKYQLRRPTMFMPCGISSSGLRRLHAIESQTARWSHTGHDLQELLRGRYRREHAEDDAERERDSEAFDQGRPEEIEDKAGDKRRNVGVTDR